MQTFELNVANDGKLFDVKRDQNAAARRVFNRVDFDGGLLRLMPALSALVVLGLGLAMTVRALPKVT